MVHLWNNRDSHGLAMIKARLEFMIIEGHDVEKESQMVDVMQSSQVWAAYLALTVTPATEGKHDKIVQG